MVAVDQAWFFFFFSPFSLLPYIPPLISQNTKAPFRAASILETPTGWTRQLSVVSTSLKILTPTPPISKMASTCQRATLAMQVRMIYLEPRIRKDWLISSNVKQTGLIFGPFQASSWARSCRAVQDVSSLPAQRRTFSSRWAASTAAWATCPLSTRRHRATLEQGTLHQILPQTSYHISLLPVSCFHTRRGLHCKTTVI